MALIRSVRAEDAEALLDLNRKLDRETSFMLLEPDERNDSVQEQAKTIARVLATPNQLMLVAEADRRLAGFLVVSGGAFRRNRRTATVVVGVAREFWGRRIASELFAAGETWARGRGLLRLELTVMVHNESAIRLYKRVGFEIEGTRRAAVEIDGKPVDELFMAKQLESP